MSRSCSSFDVQIERRTLYHIVCGVRIHLALHFGWTADLGFRYLCAIAGRHSLYRLSRRACGVHVYVLAGERLQKLSTGTRTTYCVQA